MKNLKLYNKVCFLSAFIVVTGFTSCKKFVEVEPSANLVETGKVFSSDAAAISAIAGLYNQARATNLSIGNGGLAVYAGLYADEIVNTSSNTTADPFALNSLTPLNSTVLQFWNNSYTVIYHANAILEGLNQSNAITDSIKNQLQGEALFMRGLYYFNLVNLFADVPLILTTDYKKNGSEGRSSMVTVYNQVVTDLKEAERLLKPNYPSVNRARPNRWAAIALLARVYLSGKEWKNAEDMAADVIGSGSYNLVTNLNNVFLIGSNEVIFQMASDFSNTAEAGAFIPSSAIVKPTYVLNPNLEQAFELNDQRKVNWVGSNTIAGQKYNYPYKYKNRLSTSITEYEIVLRLAEQYLLRAEARARQGKLTDANSDLNVVRKRAGLQEIFPITEDGLLKAIEQERRVELFSEWGTRWFDLKRWDKATEVLAPLKGNNWQNTDLLFPLPQAQLDLNPFLTQNPGY